MFLIFYSILQGIVQGITELLPISSTAHLLLLEKVLQKTGLLTLDENFCNMFDVVIQFGSILAFLVYFHEKLFPKALFSDRQVFRNTFQLWFKACLGVIPAGIAGMIGKDWIQGRLYGVLPIACALAIGGVVILVMEHFMQTQKPSVTEAEKLPFSKAFGIGCFQILALMPGVSRSASTIIGGAVLGCSRQAAVEYSFFLAIPTMAAASGYSLLKHASALAPMEWTAVGVGFAVSFFVSWIIVALFMRYIRTRDFRIFGWYRIVLGIVLSILLLKGVM